MSLEITDQERMVGIENRIMDALKSLQTAHYLLSQVAELKRLDAVDKDWPDVIDEAVAEAELKEPLTDPSECFE